ncbi:hypothetical protein B296_00029604 [Ensete ventricosum]|uniref:Acetyltransferase n=1 Tax=Ensete ventricosum TaxID=4639 RepID=A0A426YY28_ENSVE|nr:hypothetical protein B296_00029604 [Ensete ventricosum]
MHYIQNGLLFSNINSSLPADDVVRRLETALSIALLHFPPLAGCLVSEIAYDDEGQPAGMHVFVVYGDRGAEFTRAVAKHITVADVLSPSHDETSFVEAFFPLNGVVNYDGRSLPLLAVQFTELADGFFLACSFNHAVGDGAAYWHFFNAWAEIARNAGAGGLSRPPVHDRWFIDGRENTPLKLPYSHPDEFIERFAPTVLCHEKVFHFSQESIALLKAKANRECGTDSISSFQSISSLVWRSITRARDLPPQQKTICSMAIDNRQRLRPPLSQDYFGNSVDIIEATATAGELLARGLGWGAWLIHQALSGHGMCGVKMGSSPRFDFYSCDFGWGKPAAVRSGRANMYEGKVTFHPGREHGFGHLLGAGVHEDAAVRRRVHESRLPTSGAGDQLVQAKSRSRQFFSLY